MRRRLLPSRSAAQAAIADGVVEVTGIPEPKPATLVDESTAVRLTEPGSPFVSRGGSKLAGALDAFGIDVTGRRCLDVGASTGGFTDCLLQRYASSVLALDVGYGQLDWKVRTDPRVTVVERTNFRHADPAALGAPFEVVVADLSFISLTTVADQLVAVGAAGTDYVLLVKPQFEVGKDRVGKGGIVRDPALHREAIAGVVARLDEVGLGLRGVVASSVVGTKGNREFLVWLVPGPASVSVEDLDAVVAA